VSGPLSCGARGENAAGVLGPRSERAERVSRGESPQLHQDGAERRAHLGPGYAVEPGPWPQPRGGEAPPSAINPTPAPQGASQQGDLCTAKRVRGAIHSHSITFTLAGKASLACSGCVCRSERAVGPCEPCSWRSWCDLQHKGPGRSSAARISAWQVYAFVNDGR
jgi:hypothetical protein